MGRAVPLRGDFDAAQLRDLAKGSKDADQTRRLLALAVIYEGGRRRGAAKVGGTDLQVIRDWVLRFNAGGPDGLIDRKPPGAAPKLNSEHRAALARMVDEGPIPAIHGVVRWRIKDLVWWLHEEFAVSVDETTVGRALKDMGYVKLTARPRHHAQNEHAMEAFKKTSPAKSGRWARPSRRARP
jgi:transposase